MLNYDNFGVHRLSANINFYKIWNYWIFMENEWHDMRHFDEFHRAIYRVVSWSFASSRDSLVLLYKSFFFFSCCCWHTTCFFLDQYQLFIFNRCICCPIRRSNCVQAAFRKGIRLCISNSSGNLIEYIWHAE